jgi:hypothetical protein
MFETASSLQLSGRLRADKRYLCIFTKGCIRLAAASDKAYQLLAHGQWFAPGTSASSSTKTGHHDMTEILLKVALSTNHQIRCSVYTV